MDKKNIFFDLDDTLVNTQKTIFKRIHFLLEEFKLDINPKKVYNLLCFENRTAYMQNYLKNPVKFWDRYEELRNKIKVNSIPGTNETIQKLSSKNNLGIITNNTHEKTLEKLTLAKINPSLFMGNIYSGADSGIYKPSPKIFNKNDYSQTSLLYVGDNLIDYEFAQNIGADFYGVCTGAHNQEDFLEKGLCQKRIFANIREAFK